MAVSWGITSRGASMASPPSGSAVLSSTGSSSFAWRSASLARDLRAGSTSNALQLAWVSLCASSGGALSTGTGTTAQPA